MNKTKKNIIYLALIILVILIVSILFTKADYREIRQFILSFGILAPIAYIFVMALAVVISPIPSIPLSIWAGSVWGGFSGGVYSLIGAEIGAVAAFLIARRFGRKIVEGFFKQKMSICEKCYGRSIPIFIFFVRLLPVFHFDIISYAAGLTKIKLWKFALATFLGMIPVTFLITYYGQSFFLVNMWVKIGLTLFLILFMYLLPRYLIKRHDIIKMKK